MNGTGRANKSLDEGPKERERERANPKGKDKEASNEGAGGGKTTFGECD